VIQVNRFWGYYGRKQPWYKVLADAGCSANVSVYGKVLWYEHLFVTSRSFPVLLCGVKKKMDMPLFEWLAELLLQTILFV
jgi:hypothetical protein